MKRFKFLAYLCVGVFILSGCNRENQSAGESVPQKITEASKIEVNSVEPPAMAIIEATPGTGDKSAVSNVATKRSKAGKAFDIKRFHLARTLELPYYRDGIRRFAFSPDEKTVAGAGQGYVFGKDEVGERNSRGVVFLFDVKNGALLKRLASDALPESSGSGPNFDSASWSPDGKFLAAWNADTSDATGMILCVWDVERGQRTAAFHNANWAVTGVAWMSDNSMLVARSSRNNPADPTTKGQLMVCNGHNGQINNIYDLGKQVVCSIHVPQRGAPQLLRNRLAREKLTANPMRRVSSVRLMMVC